MPITPPHTTDAAVTTVGLAFDLTAKRDRVWRAITEEVAAWWPKDMLVGGADSKLTLEPRVGGRLYEEWGNGGACLWYTVIAIEPLSSIDLAGHITLRFGGPAISQLRIELADTGTGTHVSIADGMLGPNRGDTGRRVAQGWNLVFGQHLKQHVESR